MTIDGPGRNEQALGDRGIAHALGHQRKNLRLSTRQTEAIAAGRNPQAPRNGANAFRAHSFAQGQRRRGCAEPFKDFKCLSLFRFDAVSARRVAASGEQAGLRCDRVVPAVFADEQDPGT